MVVKFLNKLAISLIAILLVFSLFESTISYAASKATADDKCTKVVDGECEDEEYISDEELEKLGAVDIDVDIDPEPTVDEITRKNFSSDEEYKQWLKDNPQVTKQTAVKFLIPVFRAVVKSLGDGKAVRQTLKSTKKNIKVKNGKLANKPHPVTSVPFGQKGFPVFNAKATVRLSLEDIKKSSATQFKKCNQLLLIQVKTDSKVRSKFTAKELKQIENSQKPTGYTWHHHEDRGIMQLVDSQVHADTGHTGGKAIWGKLK